MSRVDCSGGGLGREGEGNVQWEVSSLGTANWRGRAQEEMEEVQELLVFRGDEVFDLGKFPRQPAVSSLRFVSHTYCPHPWLRSQWGWEQEGHPAPVKWTLPLLCELSETRSLPRAIPHPMQKDKFLFGSVQFSSCYKN